MPLSTKNTFSIPHTQHMDDPNYQNQIMQLTYHTGIPSFSLISPWPLPKKLYKSFPHYSHHPRLCHQGEEMPLFRLNWVLLLMISCLFYPTARTQMLGCYFQDVNLVPCLTQPMSGNMTQACCIALNKALNAGYRCVCSVLASTNLLVASINPLLAPPLVLSLPGCLLSSPSLAACQVPLQQLNSPPAPEKKPLLFAPVARAPAPNSTRAAKRHIGKEAASAPALSFESQGGSSGGRRKTGSVPPVMLLIPVICAWIM